MIEAVLERCAGIDIGKRELVATVMSGPLTERAVAETRFFGTTVAELERLRDWLLASGCTEACMESTGSYWKPVWNILEGKLRLMLINPSHIPGRRGQKTDRKDSRKLAHWLRHGMLTGSYVPPREIRELRDLTRRRKRLLGAAISEQNRVAKTLEDANVKLSSVLSNLFGASGEAMLEALLRGEASSAQIAELARGRLRRKIDAIAAALEGNKLGDHHRWLIRQSLEHIRFVAAQVEELEQEIVKRLQPYQRQYEVLQTIPGVKADSAASILAEIGPDMRQFPSHRHLTSWAGVSPGNHKSAGRNTNSRCAGGNRWLGAALNQCAWSAVRKRESIFKRRFHRLCPRLGPQAAITAAARCLLVVIYHALLEGQPYEERLHPDYELRVRTHMIRYHKRRLTELGVSIPSAATSAQP